MPSEPDPTRIFISYSHDSPEHEAKVLALATRLRGDGFNVIIDKDEPFPAKGWPEWMRKQIASAQFVLVVCTEKYRRRAEGDEEPGKGLGATFEGAIVDLDLYEAGGENRKFIPVLMSRDDVEHRPKVLRRYSYFVMDDGYQDLCGVLKPEPAKPDARWTVPARNEYFSARDDFLEALHNLNAPVRAIQGLGGLGKTQTAIEVAHRYRAEYTAGFWTTADSRDALVSGFAALGDQKEEDLAKAARAALRWLEENSGWLLILDNVDDWSVVREWLPKGRRGLVLITTRLQSTGTIAKGLDLPKMTPSEGAEFLLRRAKVENPSEADRAAAHEIAEKVGGLPLALDQAGAFMEEMQTSVSEYLKFYGAKLRARRGEASDHDSVTVTFTLAFEKLGERAKDIVRMCAFLAPDAIPEEILPGGAEGGLEFREAVAEAGRFSLIRRNAADKSIDIHRLVQDVMKDGMDDGTRRSWSEQVVEALNGSFPHVEFDTWRQCERLLPHAKIAAVWARESGFEFIAAARLLNQTARYLEDRAQYQEAEPLYQQALAIHEKVLGPGHPEIATSLNNLGLLFWRLHRYEEAEPLYRRALAIKDDPTSLNNLALLCGSQSRYDEAELLYQRALSITKGARGLDHPETATCLYNLGQLYSRQNRRDEAEPMLKRSLAIRERLLAPGHPDIATSLNGLAMLFGRQGRYGEAEPMFQRALEIDENAYGSGHPTTVLYAKNYAILLHKLGREDEARALEERYKLRQ